MRKSRKYVLASVGLFILGLMVARVAYIAAYRDFSVGLIIAAGVLMVTAIVLFAVYFRER